MNETINPVAMRKARKKLRAVDHRLRARILGALDSRGAMTVTELYVAFRIEQSVASQHLAILRRAGLVKTERQGKHIYYSLNRRELDRINALVKELAG